MKPAIYKDAITDISVKQLGEFLATQDKVIEIEGWSNFKAPEKRSVFLEALGQSSELREHFVGWYNETTGQESDLIEWEAADGTPPAAEPVAEEPQQTEPEPADTTSEVATATPVKAKAKPKAAPDAEIMAPFVGSFVEGAFEQIVSDAAGLDAEQSTMALKSVEEDLEFQHVRIGVLLGHISISQHYLTAGYTNMREYLEAETGLHYRKAMHLIQNAEIIQSLAIPAEELKGVSWSALRHIIPVLTTENYKEWLGAASSMKHVTLITKVKEEKVKQAGGIALTDQSKPADPDGPKVSQKIFQVYDDQKEIVNQAIDKAKIEGNTDSSGAALEIIAAAYTGAPATASTVASVMPDLTPKGLSKMFSKIEVDEGEKGCVRILEIIGEIWPSVDIAVDFGNADKTEAA